MVLPPHGAPCDQCWTPWLPRPCQHLEVLGRWPAATRHVDQFLGYQLFKINIFFPRWHQRLRTSCNLPALATSWLVAATPTSKALMTTRGISIRADRTKPQRLTAPSKLLVGSCAPRVTTNKSLGSSAKAAACRKPSSCSKACRVGDGHF